MANLNRVEVMGRIGSDIELKYTPNGQAVASFSVATSEKYKDKSGIMQEKTEWHSVVAWQKKAELINQYFSKGSRIFLEGKLQTRNWEKEGIKHYRTEIILRDFYFIDEKKKGSTQKSNQQQQNQTHQYDIPSTDFDDNQLPF